MVKSETRRDTETLVFGSETNKWNINESDFETLRKDCRDFEIKVAKILKVPFATPGSAEAFQVCRMML